MEVKLLEILVVCGVFGVLFAKSVNPKALSGLEDTYGALVDDDDDGNVQNDDYDNYGDEDGPPEPEENNDTTKNDDVKAELRTKPQTFIAQEGDTVRLPCDVSDPDVVIVWQKHDSLLYQGHIPVTKLPNILEYENGTLEVNVTDSKDFGEYICKILISDQNSPQIIHKIVSKSPPKIVELNTADNRTVYRIGESLTLKCKATGHPDPKISWHKGSERLLIKGETLTIQSLKSKDGGTYRCLADNDLTPLAHSYVEINIEQKPSVSIEKYLVNSDKENDAELKCTVQAYPPAIVIWKRDGQNIVENKPKITLRKHDKDSILVISDLKDEDFGAYTCSATNSIDRVEKTVNLVKTPAVQGFIKPEKANKEVILTWKVESKSPISEHQLQYRKKGEMEWTNIKPEVTNSDSDIYLVKYTLNGLEPGSYETRVRSQNTHGWSEYSDIMPFEGVLAKHHKHHNKKQHKEKDMKEKQITSTPEGIPAQHQENDHKESSVGASKTGGCSSLVSSVTLVSIALLILFHNRQ